MQIIARLLSILCLFFLSETDSLSQQKLLINPAGDTQRIGRYIGESSERAYTLKCALKMKTYIEETAPWITVFLTRKAGEVTPFLHNAHCANCLDVDLFISLHFYQEVEIRPHIFLYYYKNASYFIEPPAQLALYPYYNAYLFNQKNSHIYAQKIESFLSSSFYHTLFTIHTPQGLPLIPLAGVIPSALMIEAGLKDDTSWHTYIKPLCDSLIKSMKKAL